MAVLKINKFLLAFIVIFVIKIILAGLFSSEYQDGLFIPFVNSFLSGNFNPWEYVFQNNLNLEFPYHPLMLYIHSIGLFIINLLHIKSIFLTNILFKIPTIFADLWIFYLLLKIFKDKPFKVLLYYFLSPIVIYAAYMHSQLDLVPISFLFCACYCLKNFKVTKSACVYALSLCTKFTPILIFPILISYIFKNYKVLKAFCFTVIIAGIYYLISFPYLFSKGYQNMVLFNSKQDLFFHFSIDIGTVAIFVPLWATLFIYFRFFAYKRINFELLDSYIILTLAVMLLFIPPSTPAWYLWLVPFLSIFLIRYSKKDVNILSAYIVLNIVYLLYFVFFHIGDFSDLSVLGQSINLKIDNIFLKNLLYTLLETVLICNIYMIYKIGIKSNNVYGKNNTVVIGIGGDSGSGKTSLLAQLKNLLGENIITMEGDGCHKWERDNKNWDKYTHLDPKANYLYNQMREIMKLKKQESIWHSDYNHSTGKFDEAVKITPKPFVILSGLHPFYLPKMRKVMDLKIYLNTDEELRKYWKIKRDTAQRGYDENKVLKSMSDREVDSKKYIVPQKDFADLIIEYFPQEEIDYKNTEVNPKLNLKLTFTSSINIEFFLEVLNVLQIPYEWDYSNDVKTQYIIIKEDNPQKFNLNILSRLEFGSLKEMIKKDIVLTQGLDGVVEYIILKLTEDKLREDND